MATCTSTSSGPLGSAGMLWLAESAAGGCTPRFPAYFWSVAHTATSLGG